MRLGDANGRKIGMIIRQENGISHVGMTIRMIIAGKSCQIRMRWSCMQFIPDVRKGKQYSKGCDGCGN